MNDKPSLTELSAFAAICAHRSFRKAADELELSPSTLSHMMRALESRMGVRLFHRTTRSVSATEAGERLMARVGPLLRDLDLALEEVDDFRAKPSGNLRINMNDMAAQLLLRAMVPQFLALYPDIHLDLVVEGRFVDIVAEGFDAGVRLGEAVAQDMIAVRFGADTRFVPAASPDYLAVHPRPRLPQDLLQHNCIRFRMPSGKIYRWEFEKHGEELSIDVSGNLTLNNPSLMADAACRGLGIAFLSQQTMESHVEAGRLELLMEDWCPRFPGLYLYYPGHRHVPPALRVFIDVLKATPL